MTLSILCLPSGNLGLGPVLHCASTLGTYSNPRLLASSNNVYRTTLYYLDDRPISHHAGGSHPDYDNCDSSINNRDVDACGPSRSPCKTRYALKKQEDVVSVVVMILPEYNALWKAIIRPSRDLYDEHDLGPQKFRIRGVPVYREDIDLVNPRGEHLKCSWFHPNWQSCSKDDKAEVIPCVIYMHGNCSSRLEGVQAIPVLLPLNISLFIFDFAGSGRSDGEYVSLGYYEKDDLATVVDYLRKSKLVSTIGLWGRSMGAVTALLHGDRDPSIAGMVIDSAFQDMRTLATDLAQELGLRIPNIMMSAVLGMLRISVRSRAHFDIYDLEPIAHVDRTYIPALFTAARGDTFINPRNTHALYDKYAGDKNLVMVDGNHNTNRPKFLMHSIAIFFVNTLGCEKSADAVLDLNNISPSGEESNNSENRQSCDTTAVRVSVIEDTASLSERTPSPPPPQERIDDFSQGIPMPSPPRENLKFENDRLIEAAVPFSSFEEDRMVAKAIEESLKDSSGVDKCQRNVDVNEEMRRSEEDKSAL